MTYADKMSRFLLYHWEILTNMIFFTIEYVLPEKNFLEKAATIKRFGYSLFGVELKKQTGIGNNQCELFKDQINVANIKREDGVKIQDAKIIVNVYYLYIYIYVYIYIYIYIGDECKNLIANILKYGLMDVGLHLTNFCYSTSCPNKHC